MVFSALFMIITAFRFAFTFIILVVSCAINLFLCVNLQRDHFSVRMFIAVLIGMW